MNDAQRKALGLPPAVAPPPARLTGALYAADQHGGGGGQTCVFLEARLSLARDPLQPYRATLNVDGCGDDIDARTVFPVAHPMKVAHPDKDRMAWTDTRTEQRYFFDFDQHVPDDAVLLLRQKILAAIYEEKYHKPAADASQTDLLAFLWDEKAEQEKAAAQAQTDLILTSGEVLRIQHVALSRFDMKRELFIKLREEATLTINKGPQANKTSFLFYIFDASGKRVLDQHVENDILPQFDTPTLTFTWVLHSDDDTAPRLCFQLACQDTDSYVKFRDQFAVCLYEVNNQVSFDNIKQVDQDWIRESAQDDMQIDEPNPEIDDEPERRLEEPSSSRVARPPASQTPGRNSQLAVAANHDRTFVVRGDKLGVFRTTDTGPEFDTVVPFESPAGQMFSPGRVMLHQQDNAMLVLHPEDDTKISRMDLERGEIVDEWSGSTPVKSLAMSEKYSNLTPSQEFIGTNPNSLLRFDPRSPAIVAQSKNYAKTTKARLECAATTGAGHIAVASENGDIRLFDSIGKNAKTHLPGLGEKILAIDVSEDGFFVLATTLKYLLLVDTRVKGQEKGGFLKSMGGAKPPPRKLAISPQDVVKYRMGEINFTPAHFNTGTSMEKSIVASTGHFIVIWNFRQIKQGKSNCYQIKRYKDEVVADDFTYDNDGKVIVTLPDDVTMNSLRAR